MNTKYTTESHPVFKHPLLLNHQLMGSGGVQTISAVYILDTFIVYTYKCIEAEGAYHHHGSGTYELLNRRLPLWILELLPICLRLLYSYYHFVHSEYYI